MQSKLLCSLLLITGISAYASEISSTIFTEGQTAQVLNYFSAPLSSQLALFAKLDAMSSRIAQAALIEGVASESGNMVKCDPATRK